MSAEFQVAWQVMKWPLAACLLLPPLLVYLGLHVVKREVIFVDLALAQVATLGTCVGLILGYPFSARVTFWISGEPFTTPTIKNLRVTAGGTVQDFTFDNTAAWHWDMQWTQHTMDFTAGGPSTTLRFSSMDASQYGPAIDSTKVELVSAGVAPSFALAFAPVSPDPVRVGSPCAQHPFSRTN